MIFSANAQQYDTMNKYQLNEALAKAKSKIVKGVILTSCGVVSGVVGIVLANDAINYSEKYPDNESAGNMVKGFAGFGIVLTGAGLIAAGIPTWIIGGARKKKIELQLVRFNSPGSTSIPGIELKIRF